MDVDNIIDRLLAPKKLQFGSLITNLYSGNEGLVINTVDKSKYVSEAPANCIAVHTGFIFNNHKGNTFELLFCRESQELYRQVLHNNDNAPKVIGIVYKKSEEYFDSYMMACIQAAEKSGSELEVYMDDGWTAKDFNEMLAEYKTFRIFRFNSQNKKEYLANFPIKRCFETTLYMGKNSISKYIDYDELEEWGEDDE